LQVYEHLERYDGERPFRGWLYGVMRNVARNARRKQTLAVAEAEDRAQSDSGLLVKVGRRERQEQLREAFAALPDETRSLLLQRHQAGLKLDELAEAWGCTDRTIRNRLHAASDQLVQAIVALREEGDDELR
jgi:RNA polymerase sigma factor (sigma-70 family)